MKKAFTYRATAYFSHQRPICAPSHNHHQACLCQAKDNHNWDKPELPCHGPMLDSVPVSFLSSKMPRGAWMSESQRSPTSRPHCRPGDLKPALAFLYPAPVEAQAAWDKLSQTSDLLPPQEVIPRGREEADPQNPGHMLMNEYILTKFYNFQDLLGPYYFTSCLSLARLTS